MKIVLSQTDYILELLGLSTLLHRLFKQATTTNNHGMNHDIIKISAQ